MTYFEIYLSHFLKTFSQNVFPKRFSKAKTRYIFYTFLYFSVHTQFLSIKTPVLSIISVDFCHFLSFLRDYRSFYQILLKKNCFFYRTSHIFMPKACFPGPKYQKQS